MLPLLHADRLLSVDVFELLIGHRPDVLLAAPVDDLSIPQADHPRRVLLYQVQVVQTAQDGDVPLLV